MTTPSDAPMLELLAACEQLAEATDRALRTVRTLAQDHTDGRRPPDTVLLAYLDSTDRAAADLKRFRALVAELKSQFTVH